MLVTLDIVVPIALGMTAILIPRKIQHFYLNLSQRKQFYLGRNFLAYIESPLFLIGIVVVGLIMLLSGLLNLASLFGVRIPMR